MENSKGKTNCRCILGEGLFNLTGLDLLGLNSITQLFLSAYGASLGVFFGVFATAVQPVTGLVWNYLHCLKEGIVPVTQRSLRDAYGRFARSCL